MATARSLDSFIYKTSSCWIWAGGITLNGYGNYRNRGAHRAVYEALVGEIPDGMQLDHLCRVKSCVNPDHLEPVTASENMKRSMPYRELSGAALASHNMTHCKRGHEYNQENTRFFIRKDREGLQKDCRVCRKMNYNNNNARRRAARLARKLGL